MKSTRVTGIAAPIALALFTACSVNVETQPLRLEYLRDKTSKHIEKLTQCKQTTLTFRESNRIGTTWYDVYTLEGCGQKTDYITGLTRTGDWITWAYGSAPRPDELQQAAKAQLTKSAEFDLDCKTGLEFTMLSEVFDHMHTSLLASVGVRGCNKKSTYRTSCASSNYQNGKHDITCTSVVTSANTN